MSWTWLVAKAGSNRWDIIPIVKFIFTKFFYLMIRLVFFVLFYSFIADIYVVPLQWVYSEALPTAARLNNVVLSCWRNFRENTLGSVWSANGRPFQTKRPTTEKARFRFNDRTSHLRRTIFGPPSGGLGGHKWPVKPPPRYITLIY